MGFFSRFSRKKRAAGTGKPAGAPPREESPEQAPEESAGEDSNGAEKMETVYIKRAPAARPARAKEKKPRRHRTSSIQILMQKGLATKEQIQEALKIQKERKDSRPGVLDVESFIGSILIDLEVVPETVLAKVFSIYSGFPAVRLTKVKVAEDCASLVPAELARQWCVFPLKKSGRTVMLAMFDPTIKKLPQFLSRQIGAPIRPVVSPRSDIERLIEQYYPQDRPEQRGEEPPAEEEEPIENAEEPAQVLAAVLISNDRFEAATTSPLEYEMDEWLAKNVPGEKEALETDHEVFALFAGRHI